MESAELIAVLREVRDRVRARHPETSAAAPEIPLPDLLPLVHARDAALGKVAAIGTVNPRPGGPLNSLIQAWKRTVARVLDWHVRDQVEFNRNVVTALDAAIEALSGVNRSLAEVGSRAIATQKAAEHTAASAEQLAQEFEDLRRHWSEWRQGWEHKLAENEIQFLRSVADLQGAFQHRATLMDANYRDAVRSQHAEFTAALERSGIDIQKRMWADLEHIRLEFERLIYSELRTIRQRAEITGAGPRPSQEPPSPGSSHVPPAFDYGRFAERFRGSEERVKATQQMYLPYFASCRNVLDIGCGRGEFLQALQAAGVSARGIDLSAESVATCRHKGLQAEIADLFEYLTALPEASFDGIFCAQVVEHLAPERLPEMIRLATSRLERNGVIAIETPNPECLAIFATHFFLDPTHTHPVPHPLLAFYLEESGVGNIEVHKLSPAVESMPPLAVLPGEFREAFFGGLDYAITGRRL